MPIIFFGTLSVDNSTGDAGDTLTIDNTGAGFLATMIVKFGGVGGTSADNIVIDTGYGNGQQRLRCEVPAGLVEGTTYDIYLENPDGETGTIAGAFTLNVTAVAEYLTSLIVGVHVGAAV